MASPYVLLLYGVGQQRPRGDSGSTHAGWRVSGACWISCVQLLSSDPSTPPAARTYRGPHLLIILRVCPPHCSAPLHASGGPSRLSVCAISMASTRRHPPHVLATEAVRLGAPDCFAVTVTEQRGSVRWVWHGLGRRSPVVWGDAAPWFGETQPRGLGRRAPWFEETIITTNHGYRKDFVHWTVKKTLQKTTHTTPCV